MLKINTLTAHYGAAQALFGIDLAVAAGETVALVGANGAGKSSLLKCLLGLHKPTSGTILFDGKDVTKTTPAGMVRLGVALSPEGREVFPFLNVEENLMTGAYSRRDANIKSDLEMIYEYFPVLEEKRLQRAGFLSGGQQQMLAIGRALMLKPRIMLLDEPSLGLSPLLVAEIATIIQRLNHGFIIDDAVSGEIEQYDIIFHCAQALSVNHVPGRINQRHVESDKIHLRQQVVDTGSLLNVG